MERIEPTPEPASAGPLAPEPAYTLDEIYEETACRFGVLKAHMFGKSENSIDAINLPRNVAAAVAIVMGHNRRSVARFSGRDSGVIRSAITRMGTHYSRLRLAWGVVQGLGASWETFEVGLKPFLGDCPHLAQVLPLPTPKMYELAGLSKLRTETAKFPTPLQAYFTKNMELAPALIRHLGLDKIPPGEPGLYMTMLRDSVHDFLMGKDAESWLFTDEESNANGISMSDACTMVGIVPEALRRKLKLVGVKVVGSRGDISDKRHA